LWEITLPYTPPDSIDTELVVDCNISQWAFLHCKIKTNEDIEFVLVADQAQITCFDLLYVHGSSHLLLFRICATVIGGDSLTTMYNFSPLGEQCAFSDLHIAQMPKFSLAYEITVPVLIINHKFTLC
jgi:hypothetical protein